MMADTFRPIRMRWQGDGFVPVSAFWQRIADQNLVVGEVYDLVEEHERRGESHRHYFAAVKEAHNQLPDELLERFLTPDHLRKYALVKCGYYNERTCVCASKIEAQRMAAFMKGGDEFAVITAVDNIVVERTAKSQRYRAMGKKDFMESKWKVLEFVSALIGISVDDLKQNAGMAA